jgi:two-component sensor histidine kinase/ABC-type amino acid transport substrate-binding protein
LLCARACRIIVVTQGEPRFALPKPDVPALREVIEVQEPKAWKRRSWIASAALLFSMLASAYGESRIVKVGVFQASPMVSVKGDRPEGLFIDLVEHFSRTLDWKVEFVPGTWSNQLERLRRGEIDLLPAVGYTAARTEIYDFSLNPVYIDSGVVFTSRSATIHTIFDLAGKRIAALRGSTFTAAFSDFIASFGIRCDLELVEDNIEVMKRISSGEAYAGVCIYSLGNELSREYPVTVTPISFSPIALEFAVTKGRNGDLLAGIDRIMAGMIGDPSSPYSRSFEKWTVARQPVRIPPWLWAAIGLTLAIGAMLAALSLVLRREVRRKTEHLRTEIAQHEAAEARLTQALRENETLVRELYHRTKNTLQLIGSFISLESLELAPSADIDRLVLKMKNRIDAIALVHQMLYKSRDLSRISIGEYVSEIAALILRSNEVAEGRISLDLGIDDREILLDTAIPFGLILNELITNSIKHAFPDGRIGRISIGIASEGEDQLRLEYGDDGIGVPEGFDFRGQKTLGLTLLFRVVETQLKGEITIRKGYGVRYSLRIPTNLYEARV